MDAPPPQLGQGPNINLGGYIPAQVPNLKQQVLASLLSQFAGKAVDKLTTPDLAPAMGLPPAKWYQTPVNPGLAMEYGLKAPLVQPTAQNIGANTAHTQAETATVASESARRIGESGARAGLYTQEATGLASKRPFEIGKLEAETGREKAGTDYTKAQAEETRMLAPERATNLRSSSAQNIANAQATEQEIASGLPGAKAAQLGTSAQENVSRANLLDAQAKAGKDATSVANTAMTIRYQVEGSIKSRYEKPQQAAVQKAINEFYQLHGSLPYDGNWSSYINQLDQYVSKRVQ